MKMIFATAALLVATQIPADAGPTKKDCETLHGPMASVVGAFAGASKVLNSPIQDSDEVAKKLAGSPSGEAWHRFEKARLKLGEAVRGYVSAGEDLTLELQKCSR